LLGLLGLFGLPLTVLFPVPPANWLNDELGSIVPHAVNNARAAKITIPLRYLTTVGA
jgi:hypothetical protein